MRHSTAGRPADRTAEWFVPPIEQPVGDTLLFVIR
jgi:hypothetical protein